MHLRKLQLNLTQRFETIVNLTMKNSNISSKGVAVNMITLIESLWSLIESLKGCSKRCTTIWSQQHRGVWYEILIKRFKITFIANDTISLMTWGFEWLTETFDTWPSTQKPLKELRACYSKVSIHQWYFLKMECLNGASRKSLESFTLNQNRKRKILFKAKLL